MQKLRAFLKLSKEMIDIVGFRPTNEYNTTVYFDHARSHTCMKNDVVIISSTGIHDDLQDEELYEGDIVEVVYENEIVPCIIKYEAGGYLFVSNKFEDGYMPLSDLVEHDGRYVWVPDSEKVGNIYTNPELVEAI